MTINDIANKVLLEGIRFPEGLRWHGGELWFSDFLLRQVMSVDLQGKLTVHAFVSGQPSGLGFTPKGEPLVIAMFDRNLLKLDGGHRTLVANAGSVVKGPCNDMYVDRKGRAYISNFGYEAMYLGLKLDIPTNLAFVDSDGSVRPEGAGLHNPNGITMTADGKTLLVAETTERRITAFDVAENGALSNPRIWAETGRYAPDGICLDAEGNAWVAAFDAGEVVLVREGGAILETVKIGGAWATSCALGGERGNILFCAVAETDIPSMQRGVSKGWIEAVEVATPAW